MFLILCFGIFLILLLGLPPFGLLLTGYSLPSNLTLFPHPSEPGHSSISWPVFGTLGIVILASLITPLWRFFNFPSFPKPEFPDAKDFPSWGWIAILWVASSWTLAWTRFSWFGSLQPHTFPLLWLGYVIILNALTYHRSGQCLLLARPRFLTYIFILSAGFWWTFEYLNQFVKNWHYVNLPAFSDVEYLLYASLAFSTVLPAVLSTSEWLNTFPRLTRPFKHWYSLQWINDRQSGWLFLALGCSGLGLIGVWPTLLFPLLWLSPLCLLAGIQILRKANSCFLALAQGDWRPVILSALAALMCGFWWELWNVDSLAHWEYTIPYVHAIEIFEMPFLGYAGYLLFGITCLAITELTLGYQLKELS